MTRNNSTSNARRDRRLGGRALTGAQIIPFAPCLARQREQEMGRHSARLRELAEPRRTQPELSVAPDPCPAHDAEPQWKP